MKGNCVSHVCITYKLDIFGKLFQKIFKIMDNAPYHIRADEMNSTV